MAKNHFIYLVGEAVLLHDGLGLLDDPGHVDADDLSGSGLGSEHGEDAGAAANIEHDLVLEQVLVVPHRVAVGQGAHLVLEHLLVDAKMGVGIEVIVLGSHLGRGQIFDLLVLRRDSGVVGTAIFDQLCGGHSNFRL